MSRPIFPGHTHRRGVAMLAGLRALSTGYSLVYELANLLPEYTHRHARRVFEIYLVQDGMVEYAKLRHDSKSLAVAMLTPYGKGVCANEQIPVVDSEWERLKRLHDGESQPEHAAMVLLFAMRARERGCAVEVCPDVPGNFKPDVKVTMPDGKLLYVEVERNPSRSLARKWQGLIDLQGSIAVVTATEKSLPGLRERLGKYGVPLYLTDLYTLRTASARLWQ